MSEEFFVVKVIKRFFCSTLNVAIAVFAYIKACENVWAIPLSYHPSWSYYTIYKVFVHHAARSML